MNQDQKEELRMLSHRLAAKGAEPQASYGQAIERYKNLATEAQHYPALNDALYEQSNLLKSQGRYCEALQLIEDRLIQNPSDLAALRNWRNLHLDVHSILCRLADSAPETAEYGRTYEKLLQIENVAAIVHIGAVRHYLASGQIEKAVKRLIPLANIAPNAPGVADAIIRVAKLSDDVRVHQLRLQNERSPS